MKEKIIGTILSGATTNSAYCQLMESAERGDITEGLLLIVKTVKGDILVRTAEIIPYNAFYQMGDPWSEVRRKGGNIPKNIARQYEICKLDLLMTMEKGKSKDIKFPPLPGEKVIALDLDGRIEELFGISENEKGHIWYGSLIKGKDIPVPLNVEKLPMHLAIFGVTGSGKSYDTGVFIEQLVRIPVNETSIISYPMIIIDAHGDYLDYVNHFNEINRSEMKSFGSATWIRRFIFPNAKRKVKKSSDKNVDQIFNIALNLNHLQPREIAETIVLFYKGRISIESELQVTALEILFEKMLDTGQDINDLFINKYRHLREELGKIDHTIVHTSSKRAAIRAIDKFQKEVEKNNKLLSTDSLLQKEDFVDQITKNGGIAIIDFSADGAPGISIQLKQLVMTYLASTLFSKFTEYKIKNSNRFLLFMIEEAQNFCPSSSFPVGSSLGHQKLSAIATQGRKFGLSLCLISQRPSFVDKIVLSMCNTFLIHRISPEDVGFVQSVTGGLPTSLSRNLTRLSTGDAILTGQMCCVPFPLKINIPFKSRKIKHTVGTTDVVKSLAKLRGVKYE